MDEKDKKITAFWVFVVLLASVTAFYSGVVYDSHVEHRIVVKEPQTPPTELTNFTYYLNLSNVNLSCGGNPRFFSDDYGGEYEAKCRTAENWVTILLPRFNLTKNTTMWVHWSEGKEMFRRKVTISPYEGDEVLMGEKIPMGVVMSVEEIKAHYVAWRLNEGWASLNLTGTERMIIANEDYWCDCAIAPDMEWVCKCYDIFDSNIVIGENSNATPFQGVIDGVVVL